MSISITDAQKVQLTAVAHDAAGAVDPAAVVTWVSADTAVATVDTTGMVTSVTAGSTTVTATATDPDGNHVDSAPFGVTVTAGDAANVGVTAGTPVAK